MQNYNLQPSVLVVDDEKDLLDLIAMSLRSGGFEIAVAGTIGEARERFAKTHFDLVIIDLRLPDGNGLTFSEELRAKSDIGIIIMTGTGDDVDRILGLELGADDYIDKPFRQRELLARARAVLRRTMQNTTDRQESPDVVDEDIIMLRDYCLNKSARSLVDGTGAAVNLTTLEFDVLAVLASQKGVVHSRPEIYKSARLRAGEPGRLVDGLISRLRKKLFSEDEARQRIQTVHGRGYMLVD